MAAGLPNVFAYFAAAGIVAAALVAAAAATVALGNVLTEDVVNGFSWEPIPMDAIEVDESKLLTKLWREQEKM